MARRKKQDLEITLEQRTKINEIADRLVLVADEIDALESEAEKQENGEVYVELLQAIHRRLEDRLYNLAQTLRDADDSEMRSPK